MEFMSVEIDSIRYIQERGFHVVKLSLQIADREVRHNISVDLRVEGTAQQSYEEIAATAQKKAKDVLSVAMNNL